MLSLICVCFTLHIMTIHVVRHLTEVCWTGAVSARGCGPSCTRSCWRTLHSSHHDMWKRMHRLDERASPMDVQASAASFACATKCWIGWKASHGVAQDTAARGWLVVGWLVCFCQKQWCMKQPGRRLAWLTMTWQLTITRDGGWMDGEDPWRLVGRPTDPCRAWTMAVWEQTLVGASEQLGCWSTPACQGVASSQAPSSHVGHPFNKASMLTG